MFTYKKNIIRRFKTLLIFGFSLWALIIVVKAIIIITLERQYWLDVSKNAIVYNRTIEPRRGDILSDNGELLVSNMIKYRLYLNFDNLNDYNYGDKKKKELREKKDSIWKSGIDSLCSGLANIFPQWTKADFMKHLSTGVNLKRGDKSRYGRKKYPLYPNHQLYVTYTQYLEASKLPILREKKIHSGFFVEEYMYRKKFFGSLAYSTLGDHKVLSKGNAKKPATVDKHGLDEKFDSILRGRPGIMHTEKEKEIVDVPVIHGMDVQTTINVEMQDICEKALRDGLTEFGSKAGWVILMEVESGDIKAIVNLSQVEDGNYVETYEASKNNETPNHAIADLREPGSIFKPIALSIALDDKKISEHDSVRTHNGTLFMHGRYISDAVKPKRKWQTVTEVIQNSSNVGMALIIDSAYRDNPERFTDRLVELGMKTNYNLLECERTPTFRTPKSRLWSKPDLQAMSRGYATSQTALNMITFYNGIANKGVRMAPRLVKAIMKDGEVVEKYDPVVLDDEMLSQSTVAAITRMLKAVVNEKRATGARAKSHKVSIAGKTGTALNNKGNLLSFCGFFPVDKPEYTCIVQNINNNGGGGSTSAVIFKEIAEQIMAKSERQPLENAKDTINTFAPIIKRGNMTAVDYILDKMDIDVDNSNISSDSDDPTWGAAKSDSTGQITYEVRELNTGIVPNVIGMGAKDAIYLMQRAGLKVTISGYGKVTSQSLTAGHKATKGTHVRLTLKP